MNRLTTKFGQCAKNGTDFCLKHKDCNECAHYREMLPMLAAYESTELTPNEILELVEVKKEGRLVILPVVVDDVVYQLRTKKHAHGEGIAKRIAYGFFVQGPDDWSIHHQGTTPCHSDELGKTWALTEEAAEGILKKRGGEGIMGGRHIVDETYALIKTKAHRAEKERNRLKSMIDQIHEALDEANSTLYKHKDIQTRLTISGLTLGKIAVIVKHEYREDEVTK